MSIATPVVRVCRIGLAAALALSLSGCSYIYQVVLHNGSGGPVELRLVKCVDDKMVVVDRIPIPEFGSIRISESRLWSGFRIARGETEWRYPSPNGRALEDDHLPHTNFGYTRHVGDGIEYHLGIGRDGELIALRINEDGQVTAADPKQPENFPMRPLESNPS